MKQKVTVILLSSTLLFGAFGIKITMANTTEKQDKKETSYDSPLMNNGDESLSKMNLLSYDIKDYEIESKEVDSFDTDESGSIYGVSIDDTLDSTDSRTSKSTKKNSNSKSTSKNTKNTEKEATQTHTNLPMDENDANYKAPYITYYTPDGNTTKGNETEQESSSNNGTYSDYKYSYNSLAKSAMLQALRRNKEFSKASKTRQEVILYAMQYVGNKYVFGGESITDGIDCSAFTRYVMKHFGKKLPRNSYSQRSSGKSVDKPNTGDLICYSGHVAIYIGDGKIIHASNRKPYPRGGIKISSNYKYRTIKAIRSLFDD